VILLYCGGAAVEGILAMHASRAIGFLPTFIVLVITLMRHKD
jgi:hypothetical protein